MSDMLIVNDPSRDGVSEIEREREREREVKVMPRDARQADRTS